MSVNNHEESIDAFEQAPDEVLMYTYSEHIPSVAPRHKTLKQQSPRLQLVQMERNLCIDVPRKQRFQNGRIIKLGSAVFKSNFQCGNLANVEQINLNTYALTMEKESNSTRLSAWFYFACEGLKGEVNFHVQGFTKTTSLHNEGMKICFKDSRDHKWRRGCTHISYSAIPESNPEAHELRFTYFFKNNEYSSIQFAYCFPYSFKNLLISINSLGQHVKQQSLGKSFDGRDIPLLTIGNQNSPKVIVLSGRVHPGQTVSSFIMEGLLRELTSESEWAIMLRQSYLFKVVPMLNPDGVARGNYRFSASGYDLNRKWKKCKENSQPQIYLMREFMKKLKKEKQIIMYIDMHGHSRKKNVFFYGCCDSPTNTVPKEFPFLMEKLDDAFKYSNCTFAIQKDKEGTARVAMWKELKIDYIYTLESSFCGGQTGGNYLEADYLKIGKKLCEGIAAQFYDEANAKGFKQLQKIVSMKKKAIQQLQSSPELLSMGAQEDSGSDSEPEKGQYTQQSEIAAPTQATDSLGRSTRQVVVRSSKGFIRSIPKNSSRIRGEHTLSEEVKAAIFTRAMDYTQDPPPSLKIMHKPEIKLSSNVATYDMDSLKTSALYQKNIRVHSLSRNMNRMSNRINQFEQAENTQGQDRFNDRIKINLMHAREGAQYRRVRKMAECKMQKDNKQIKCLLTNNMEIDKCQTIAPRFYPVSQQRNRRTSAQTYFKRMKDFDGKRISINGDQLNVRCLGNKIIFS